MGYRSTSPPPDNAGGSLMAKAVISGLLVTILLALLLSAVVAVLIFFTELTEGTAAAVLYYLGLVCVTIGGAFAARRSRKMGWVHGGLVGLGYAILCVGLSYMITPGAFLLWDILRRVGAVIAVGVLGGIMGVNL